MSSCAVSETRRANLAAVAAILLAGALSTVWAFLVPIFQAPDEPAHFDYALSIYSAHRLIRLSDGGTAWIVNPYTKYLLKAFDFERIAWHSSMRAPGGYGTRGYYARIDAAAPSLHQPSRSGGKINYIVPLYPFGFYALEALWMHGVSLFTSSITAVYFSARLLCVFLMMIGLYCNYRTAINLGLPRWTSVALIAAIGLFPLTSFVSSYVQPDNLAYALLSAALFFATELRVGKISSSTIVALGIAMGLLAVTKYQFFVSAAIPIGALCAVRLTQAKLCGRAMRCSRRRTRGAGGGATRRAAAVRRPIGRSRRVAGSFAHARPLPQRDRGGNAAGSALHRGDRFCGFCGLLCFGKMCRDLLAGRRMV